MPGLIKLADCSNANAALGVLCDGFAGPEPHRGCEQVEPHDLPELFRGLLVHDEHMTVTLKRHYGRPVELQVLRETPAPGEGYRREITLTLPGSGEVVEYGVVRIDLGAVPDRVREEILARRIPLGDILVSHDVLRRVAPRWYLRLGEDSPFVQHFHGPHPGGAYGRIGTIFCDHQPAIELLEVVSGADGRSEA